MILDLAVAGVTGAVALGPYFLNRHKYERYSYQLGEKGHQVNFDRMNMNVLLDLMT